MREILILLGKFYAIASTGSHFHKKKRGLVNKAPFLFIILFIKLAKVND